MKLGVLTVLFGGQPLEKALDYIKEAGLQAVEIGTGNYPGDAHCKLDAMLKSEDERKKFMDAIKNRGLEISALSCHGNALHPDKKFSSNSVETLKKTIQLAKMLKVKTVIDFSGCPGEGPNATKPNWVTCPWPPDFLEILEWQWDKVAIPFWKEMNKYAADNGVRIAFEMHPGFVVYSPETMLRIRDACGKNIGANLDPSHLFWQGIDPIVAVRELGKAKAIFHIHMKDTKIDPINTAFTGVLDTKHYGDIQKRAWVFRTVGYGHGAEFWTNFISTLRAFGYDEYLSIEHEDGLMSTNEGFMRAVRFLQSIMMSEKPGAMWWA
jgi:sugar phosphate isomerase/epimerase